MPAWRWFRGWDNAIVRAWPRFLIMRTNWKSWIGGKWHLDVPIGFWVLLVGWVIASLEVDLTFWPATAIIPMYEQGLPILLGIAALLCGSTIVALAFARIVPLGVGIISGVACAMAGLGFWYLFGLFISAV